MRVNFLCYLAVRVNEYDPGVKFAGLMVIEFCTTVGLSRMLVMRNRRKVKSQVCMQPGLQLYLIRPATHVLACASSHGCVYARIALSTR